MDQSMVNSLNRIDRGTQVEITNLDEDRPPALSDATFEKDPPPRFEGSTTAKPGFLAWLFTPLSQSTQLNPQSLLQNRLAQLKEALNNFNLKPREDVRPKQLTSPNDPGFYTNRLEPAGFFGGNGWLANKGGILGGPGAILSTGSLFTDYPTAYRRK